jgi:hypothetical protein
MATTPTIRKDSLDILLDKISIMRDELLTIERAVERMQREAVELTQSRDGSPSKRFDESGIHKGDHLCVVAGFVGNDAQWLSFIHKFGASRSRRMTGRF